MKKYFLLAIVVVIIVAAAVLRLVGSGGRYIAEEKTANLPSADQERIVLSEKPPVEVMATPAEVEIFSPRPDETVKAPLVVMGQAKGSWFFEASLPVRLEDANGQVIASVPGEAQSDWMTTGTVPFVAKLDFSLSATTTDNGFLVISKDNPSGLPENDASFRWPVRFR